MDNLKSTLEFTNKEGVRYVKDLSIWGRMKYRFGRVPIVGEQCYMAGKQFIGEITFVDRDDFTITIHSDAMVCRSNGTWCPRWITSAKVNGLRWSDAAGYWIWGKGPWPKKKIQEYIAGGGVMLMPEPVMINSSMARMIGYFGPEVKGK